MKFLHLSILLLFISVLGAAQEISRFDPEEFEYGKNYGYFNYIQIFQHRGQHYNRASDVEHIFDQGFWAWTLRVGTQSNGREEWQRLHNYPQYGLGVSYFNLGGTDAKEVLGSPSSIFFYFGEPIIRKGKFTLNTDLELGLAYDFIPFDPESNPQQDVIGGSVNMHFSLNALLYYQLSRRIDLSIGYALTHFSNGRSFTPQKGINMLGGNFSAVYHFNPIKNYTKHINPNYQPPIRPEFTFEPMQEYSRIHELQLMTAVGLVRAEPYKFKNENGQMDTTGIKGPHYLTSSIALDYAYQFGRRAKATIGLDVFFDGSAEYLYDGLPPGVVGLDRKVFYGSHVGAHYLIERFAVLFNFGFYLHKPFPQRGRWYMRIGGRIGLTENLDVHIALKTRNGGIADWIEWGMAYKLKRVKNKN